jgi:hypothetical protein
MAIPVKCLACGNEALLPNDLAGQMIRCVRCARPMNLASNDQMQAAPPVLSSPAAVGISGPSAEPDFSRKLESLARPGRWRLVAITCLLVFGLLAVSGGIGWWLLRQTPVSVSKGTMAVPVDVATPAPAPPRIKKPRPPEPKEEVPPGLISRSYTQSPPTAQAFTPDSTNKERGRILCRCAFSNSF